jgi:hypothetical protein
MPAAVLPAAIWSGLFFGALDNSYGAGLVCLAAAVLLVWQLWIDLPSGRFWIAVAPAFAAIAPALAWAALASLATNTSLTPDLARHGLIGAIGYTLLLLLGCLIGYRRRSIADILRWLLVFGSVNTAFGLILYATRSDPLFGFWDLARSGRFLGTVDNANVAGVLCGVVAVLAAARLFGSRVAGAVAPAEARHWVVAGCTLALGLAAIGLILTASRSGVVLVGVALLCLTWKAHSGEAASLRRGPGLLIAAAAALVVLLATTLPDTLINRFTVIGEGTVGRREMWAHFGTLAANSPWFGYGFGSFPSLNARYPDGIDLAGRLWMVNSPHDIGLHLLLTGGVPYLLLLLIAAALIARTILKGQHRRGGGMDPLAALLAAGIILGSSLVDLALEMPAIAGLFVTLVGLVWGGSLPAAERR